MWNNRKGIPENFNFEVTSLYEYGKNIGEYMSSDGDCLAHLEVGKFQLYLDLVGEASFKYKGEIFEKREELDAVLKHMIRKQSPEIEWIQKPELRLYLSVASDAYSGFELDIDCEFLWNKLAMEVMMTRLLVDSIYLIERDKVESDNNVVGISSVLKEEDQTFLEILNHYKQSTSLLPMEIAPETGSDMIHNRIMKKPDLANVVSLVNVMTQYSELDNQVEITTSWSSDNEAVNSEMVSIACDWK